MVGAASPLRILVVDDEEIIRDLCTSALEEAGHRSRTAEDGNEALAVLDEEGFDGVLLDMAFRGPPMGRPLYDMILGAHPELQGRVAVITGVLEREDIDRFRQEGVPVLEKPFELADMIRTVQSFGPR